MNLFRKLKKLKYWLPVIWQDHDWDHYYFVKMLRHKLISMLNFYTSDQAWCSDAEEISNQIHECVIILDRIIEDNYNKIAWIRHDLTWGELELGKDEKGYPIFTRKHAITDELRETEKKRFMTLCEQEDKLRKEDIKKLFELIGENFENWWD